MPEIQIPVPAAPKTFQLSSGKTVTFHEPKGRDLMKAQAITAKSKDALAVIYALIACVAQVDGKMIVYEDILDMPLLDVVELQNGVLGENFQSPPPPASPDSSTSDSGLAN